MNKPIIWVKLGWIVSSGIYNLDTFEEIADKLTSKNADDPTTKWQDTLYLAEDLYKFRNYKSKKTGNPLVNRKRVVSGGVTLSVLTGALGGFLGQLMYDEFKKMNTDSDPNDAIWLFEDLLERLNVAPDDFSTVTLFCKKGLEKQIHLGPSHLTDILSLKIIRLQDFSFWKPAMDDFILAESFLAKKMKNETPLLQKSLNAKISERTLISNSLENNNVLRSAIVNLGLYNFFVWRKTHRKKVIDHIEESSSLA